MTERADFEAMMAAYSKVNAARHTELDDFAEGWQARAALSQQAEPVAGHSLLPCPFCGHQPDEENMIDSTHPINHEGTLWTTGCLENEGGCNASMLAGSRQEAINKWNTRAALSQQQAEPALRLTVTVDDSNPLDRHHFELVWLQTPYAAGEYLYYAAPPANDEAVRLLREARELIEYEVGVHPLMNAIDAYLARVSKPA